LQSPKLPVNPDNRTVKWLTEQLIQFSELKIEQKTDVIRNIVEGIQVDRNGNMEISYLF